MSGRFKKASGDFPPSEACLEMALGERLWQELCEGNGGPWWHRLQGVNQQLLTAYGLPLPGLRLDRASELDPNSYRFRLAGGPWEQGVLHPGRWFATGDPETVSLLMGELGHEPVYGLEGRWIPESRAEGAAALGCHLLTPEALWVGHLCDRVENRLNLCLSADWLQRRLRHLELKSPGPAFLEALCCLLEERCTIAPLGSLAEAYRSTRGDLSKKLRAMRLALGPRVATPWLNEHDGLAAVTLTETASRRLRQELARKGGPEGWFLGLLLGQLREEVEWAMNEHGVVALLTASDLRRSLFELLPFELRRTPVLSFEELPVDIDLETVGIVGSRLHPLAGAWPRSRSDVNAL
ncbi:MAG: FHIPEP family type III secretion protein [Candidatus Eremiobacteraeota bacterium]|nr:FHIPEP family type III secretion protein [Candidatus Eremiobacteraeota bacterium]